jgi:NAD(P)-dependent dehydrogenase (short-subunit alcohol dehydrogenase family)
MGERLLGKRALVTGAGGGIGRASALAFAREGAAVAVADVRRDAAEAVAAEIAAVGGRAIALAVDVSNEAACAAMVEETERKLGGLDTLFNNAGVCLPGDNDVTDTPLGVWERTLAIDLTGVFLCCKFGIPALLRAGGGAIVNNASMVALVGSAFPQIAYTAAKGGVVAMTRELAIVYGRRGIRVNAICPGPVRTAMSDLFFNSEEKWLSRRRYMPMGRLGTVEEVAAVALFLASNEASYVTGSAYTVDGGITAAYVIDDSVGT